MKTKNIITILTCAPSADNCTNCPAQQDCTSIVDVDAFNILVAKHLEQLITQLKVTKDQLDSVRNEKEGWRKKYENIVHDLRIIMHTHDLTD